MDSSSSELLIFSWLKTKALFPVPSVDNIFYKNIFSIIKSNNLYRLQRSFYALAASFYAIGGHYSRHDAVYRRPAMTALVGLSLRDQLQLTSTTSHAIFDSPEKFTHTSRSSSILFALNRLERILES